jgi:hypothetical protein
MSKTLSQKEKGEYIQLFREFEDAFAWKYEDLKTYDPTIFRHQIPLKEDIKTFIQKQRQLNPMLPPLVQKEVNKLCDAKIIIPFRYSDWVANLVLVINKNGENKGHA